MNIKHVALSLIAGIVIGAGAGFAAGIISFPYIFPPPEVNETVANKESKQVLATGTFIHSNLNDPVHYGKGNLTIYDDLVHLESDFEVGPGPKYHVYLVPKVDVMPDTDVESTMFVDLGRLKAFSGSQNYQIPNGINLVDYQSVVIWCEQFGVLISPANLAFN